MRHRGSAALLLVAALALLATAGACGGDAEGQRPPGQSAAAQTAASSQARAVTLAPESAMPQFPAGTSADTVIAYRYAVANPDVLRVMPCYCGCGSVGHMSNLDCYVSEYRADGTPVFDGHAVF